MIKTNYKLFIGGEEIEDDIYQHCRAMEQMNLRCKDTVTLLPLSKSQPKEYQNKELRVMDIKRSIKDASCGTVIIIIEYHLKVNDRSGDA